MLYTSIQNRELKNQEKQIRKNKYSHSLYGHIFKMEVAKGIYIIFISLD